MAYSRNSVRKYEKVGRRRDTNNAVLRVGEEKDHMLEEEFDSDGNQ